MAKEPTAGQKAARTKGPVRLKEAGSEAASTKTIREVRRRLDRIAADLAAVQELLSTVDSKAKRGKRTP
jgi:hypothetical protein